MGCAFVTAKQRTNFAFQRVYAGGFWMESRIVVFAIFTMFGFCVMFFTIKSYFSEFNHKLSSIGTMC